MTIVAQADFTGDPSEETSGVAVTFADLGTDEYVAFYGVESNDGFVSLVIDAASKTSTGFTVYPSGAFVGAVNFLILTTA